MMCACVVYTLLLYCMQVLYCIYSRINTIAHVLCVVVFVIIIIIYISHSFHTTAGLCRCSAALSFILYEKRLSKGRIYFLSPRTKVHSEIKSDAVTNGKTFLQEEYVAHKLTHRHTPAHPPLSCER